MGGLQQAVASNAAALLADSVSTQLGVTYWVDATLGDDGNAGSLASPWQTLGRAFDAGPPTVAAGDRIIFMPGTYTISADETFTTNGAANAPIEFVGLNWHLAKALIRHRDPTLTYDEEMAFIVGTGAWRQVSLRGNWNIWNGFYMKDCGIRAFGGDDILITNTLACTLDQPGATGGSFYGLDANRLTMDTVEGWSNQEQIDTLGGNRGSYDPYGFLRCDDACLRNFVGYMGGSNLIDVNDSSRVTIRNGLVFNSENHAWGIGKDAVSDINIINVVLVGAGRDSGGQGPVNGRVCEFTRIDGTNDQITNARTIHCTSFGSDHVAMQGLTTNYRLKNNAMDCERGSEAMTLQDTDSPNFNSREIWSDYNAWLMPENDQEVDMRDVIGNPPDNYSYTQWRAGSYTSDGHTRAKKEDRNSPPPSLNAYNITSKVYKNATGTKTVGSLAATNERSRPDGRFDPKKARTQINGRPVLHGAGEGQSDIGIPFQNMGSPTVGRLRAGRPRGGRIRMGGSILPSL